MEDQKIELLNYLIDAIKYGKDQFPDIARQYIIFSIAQDIVWIMICFCISYASYRLLKWALGRIRKGEDDIIEAMSIPGALSGFIAVPFFIYNCFDLFKAIFAPKLYILSGLIGIFK